MFYLDLFRCLATRDVDYLVVGGLAMNLHGVPRLTMDVDLALVRDPDNVRAFVDCAATLGLTPSVPVALADLADPQARAGWIRDKHLVALPLRAPAPEAPTPDVVLDHHLDMTAAISRAVTRELAGVRVRVAAIEDLIAMKRHAGRAQDLADVAHLERLRAR